MVNDMDKFKTNTHPPVEYEPEFDNTGLPDGVEIEKLAKVVEDEADKED